MEISPNLLLPMGVLACSCLPGNGKLARAQRSGLPTFGTALWYQVTMSQANVTEVCALRPARLRGRSCKFSRRVHDSGNANE